MSEPASLYARLHLSEAGRAAYRASVPPPPNAYPDWESWLAGRQMHGSLSVAGLSGTWVADPAGSILEAWLDPARSFPGNASSKADSDTWRLSLLEFSENYGEWVSLLTVLRSAAPYVDPDRRSLVVVHDFLWGDPETDVAIELAAGESRILDVPPAADVAEADRYLQAQRDGLDPMS